MNGAQPPYGYTIVNQHFQIDPVEGPVAKRIFELYDNGATFADIVRTLNNDGIKKRSGKKWTNGNMRIILSNERYIGVYKFGNVRVEDGIPAIIDKERWDRVQRRLKLSKKNKCRNSTNLKFLLSSRVFCSHCGRNYIADSGTSKTGDIYRYYTCLGKKNRMGCKAKSIRKDKLESFVIDKTMEIVNDDDLINRISDQVIAMQENGEREKYKQSLIAEKKSAEKSVANIMAAIEAGIFTPTTKDRLNDLEEQIQIIDESISEIDIKFPPVTKEFVVWYIKQFRNISETEKEKKEMVRALVNSILISDDTVTIVFNYTKKRLEDNEPALKSSYRNDMVGYSQDILNIPMIYDSYFCVNYLKEAI